MEKRNEPEVENLKLKMSLDDVIKFEKDNKQKIPSYYWYL